MPAVRSLRMGAVWPLVASVHHWGQCDKQPCQHFQNSRAALLKAGGCQFLGYTNKSVCPAGGDSKRVVECLRLSPLSCGGDFASHVLDRAPSQQVVVVIVLAVS